MNLESLDLNQRWPGAPLICEATNLPAFESPQDLKEFMETLPAVTITQIIHCPHCDGYHADTHLREPAGATSGTGTREETGKPSKVILDHQSSLARKYWDLTDSPR